MKYWHEPTHQSVLAACAASAFDIDVQTHGFIQCTIRLEASGANLQKAIWSHLKQTVQKSHVKWHFCCLVITSCILVFTYAIKHLRAPIKKYQLWFECVSSHRCAHFTAHVAQEHFLLFKIKYLRWNNSVIAADVSPSRGGRQHNAIISPVYTSTPTITKSQWCSALCVSPTIEQLKKRERGRDSERERSWYKRKARAKRPIILQQKWVRMVGLHLYTLPFVQAHSYWPSINRDIKKLW